MADFEFRRVRPADFAYCWPIYSEAMAPLVTGWNAGAQRLMVEQVLGEEGASILVVDKSDTGWLHVTETRFDIHLGHLYLEADRRGQGLGTRLLQWMIDRARRKAKTFTLDVVANNRAHALYERLGFVSAGKSGGMSAGKIRMQHRAS
jgi:GNAT superfamily N-acetyltransferase